MLARTTTDTVVQRALGEDMRKDVDLGRGQMESLPIVGDNWHWRPCDYADWPPKRHEPMEVPAERIRSGTFPSSFWLQKVEKQSCKYAIKMIIFI